MEWGRGKRKEIIGQKQKMEEEEKWIMGEGKMNGGNAWIFGVWGKVIIWRINKLILVLDEFNTCVNRKNYLVD